MDAFQQIISLLTSALDQMEALVALQTSTPISSVYREKDVIKREEMKESAETVIEQVDSQCGMLEDLSERLSSVYGKLHHKRQLLRNSLVPVSSLPEELLEVIFRMAIESSSSCHFEPPTHPQIPREQPDTIDIIQLSHVCVLWRAVAQGKPFLKSYAVIPQNKIGGLKRIVNNLAHASQRLVTIHILPPTRPSHSQRIIPKLQHLSITLGKYQVAGFLSYLGCTYHEYSYNTYTKFPNLVSLAVEAPCLQPKGDMSVTLKWNLPKLETAHLHGCLLSLRPHLLPSLQRLQLQSVTFNHMEFLNMRNLSAQLESLILFNVTIHGVESEFPTQDIETTLICPYLSHISIHECSFDMQELYHLLGSLETPLLKGFMIGDKDDWITFCCKLEDGNTSLIVKSRFHRQLSTAEMDSMFMQAFIMIQNASETIQHFKFKGPLGLFEQLGPYMFKKFPTLISISIKFNSGYSNSFPHQNNTTLWTYNVFPNILWHHRHQLKSIEAPPGLFPSEGLDV